MQIVLSILAVLGVILLVLLLLVLFLLAALLFAPFRYRIRAEKEAEVKADVRIHWLLHAVAVRISYAAEGLQWTLRVFGIPVKQSGGKQDGASDEDKPPEEAPETAALQALETEEEKEKPPEDAPAAEPATKPPAPQKAAESVAEPEQAQAENGEPEEPEKPKGSFLTRIREKLRGLWETARCLYELFLRKKNLLRDYLAKKSVKQALGTLWEATKWLLLHIAPRTLSGSVVFGSQDPATTGQAAAVAGALYPLYGEKFSFAPDFDEPGLRGNLECAGRIRLFGILVRAVRLYRDQNLRNVIQEAQQVKEQMLATVPEMKQVLGKA